MFYNRTVRENQLSMFYNRPTFRHFDRHSFGHQMTSWTTHNWTYATPETDVLELDDQYILQVALPGVVLDDVELKVEDNLLSIMAKRTPAMYEERADILRKELPCFLVREFEFETEIYSEQIEARLDRGILFISIPKVEIAHRIPVSAGTFEGHLPGMKTRVQKSESLRREKEVTIK